MDDATLGPLVFAVTLARRERDRTAVQLHEAQTADEQARARLAVATLALADASSGRVVLVWTLYVQLNYRTYWWPHASVPRRSLYNTNTFQVGLTTPDREVARAKAQALALEPMTFASCDLDVARWNVWVVVHVASDPAPVEWAAREAWAVGAPRCRWRRLLSQSLLPVDIPLAPVVLCEEGTFDD